MLLGVTLLQQSSVKWDAWKRWEISQLAEGGSRRLLSRDVILHIREAAKSRGHRRAKCMRAFGLNVRYVLSSKNTHCGFFSILDMYPLHD